MNIAPSGEQHGIAGPSGFKDAAKELHVVFLGATETLSSWRAEGAMHLWSMHAQPANKMDSALCSPAIRTVASAFVSGTQGAFERASPEFSFRGIQTLPPQAHIQPGQQEPSEHEQAQLDRLCCVPCLRWERLPDKML
jgi:hypothetical protein